MKEDTISSRAVIFEDKKTADDVRKELEQEITAIKERLRELEVGNNE